MLTPSPPLYPLFSGGPFLLRLFAVWPGELRAPLAWPLDAGGAAAVRSEGVVFDYELHYSTRISAGGKHMLYIALLCTDGLSYKGGTSTHAPGTDPRVAVRAYMYIV